MVSVACLLAGKTSLRNSKNAVTRWPVDSVSFVGHLNCGQGIYGILSTYAEKIVFACAKKSESELYS